MKKRKSGTETRRRTEKINLRVLPTEQRALRVLADRAGHRSVQAWILETIAPHMNGVDTSETRLPPRRGLPMGKTRTKRRRAPSASSRPGRPTGGGVARDGIAVANAELHQELIDRGWAEWDRADGLIMYDWRPSAPDDDHESTYVIVDLRGLTGVGPPYRVSVVNGDRMMYEDQSELEADLDAIEAGRCATCTPSPHAAQ